MGEIKIVSKPLFTIVLPVRNGGSQLKDCVNSVLAQTLGNFELAVLENCSSDGSREWLDEVRDPRVRVYAASEPLSMRDNWARSVGVPKNEFVTFMGHDDMLDPNYLETMRALIAANPGAGLYHAHFRFIDDAGQTMRSCRPMPAHETAAQFCKAFLQFERDANGTGYVVRSSEFDRVGGFPPFHNMLYADHALWLKLVGDSFVVTAPEECFSYRLHAASTSASAQWRDHLKAIEEFIPFMKQAGPWGTEVTKVLDGYAPGYFLTLCKNWYSNALVVATKHNRRVEPGVVAEFVAALRPIAPNEAAQFRNLKSVRVYELINSNPITRRAYNLYILLRYGKGELPSG